MIHIVVYMFLSRTVKIRPFSCCSIIHSVIEIDIKTPVDHLMPIWNAIRHQAI